MNIPNETLSALQTQFHALIRERAGELIDKHDIPLPELSPLPESDSGAYFEVDGMYGGFSYRLEGEGHEAMLVVESWCRVVQGSGQRHHVTTEGYRLIEQGFV